MGPKALGSTECKPIKGLLWGLREVYARAAASNDRLLARADLNARLN